MIHETDFTCPQCGTKLLYNTAGWYWCPTKPACGVNSRQLHDAVTGERK